MSLEQLVLEAQSGRAGEGAFAKVCERFTGLVKKYANQPHLAGIREDAMAEGWLAVAAAVRAYDESSGVRFAGFVESKVRFAVWNLFKRERRRWQNETALTGGTGEREEEGVGFLDTVPSDQDVAGEVESRLTAALLTAALSKLPDKQQSIIAKTILGEESLTSVARELGVSPQAVFNMRQRGLSRLKSELSGMYESVRG